MKINYLKTKILAKAGSLLSAGFLLSNKTLAAAPRTPPQQTVGIDSISTLATRFETIVAWVQYVFFAVATMYIILAAFAYLTSGGDETKIKTAKDRLLYAVVAIAVALLAYAMKVIVEKFLRTGQ